MKLVVNSEGVYLTKVGECFCLKKEGQKQEIAAKKVEQIIITTSTALSTDAIELAIENNIDIVFLKKYGKPFGRVWHSKVGSISTIRKRQLNLDSNKMGTILVKEFLTQKMTNQVEFLNELSMNRRDNRKIEIKEDIEKILKLYIEKYYDENDDKQTWFNKIKELAGEMGYAKEVKEFKANPEAYKAHVGDVSTALRVALTARTNTPDMYEIMKILGKERMTKRFNTVKF